MKNKKIINGICYVITAALAVFYLATLVLGQKREVSKEYDLYYVDDELSRNYSSYYDGTEYENGYGYTDFEDTDYYSSYSESSSSYNDDWDGDNGGDWDYGGNWDAGDTNWDTDW